jgi:hypothetical protein
MEPWPSGELSFIIGREERTKEADGDEHSHEHNHRDVLSDANPEEA